MADEEAIDDRGWSLLSGYDIGDIGDPYLDRLCIVRTPFFSLYLHHIHRPDSDPDPHDHPWTFASLVLCGEYRELIWPDKANTQRTVTRHRNRLTIARTGRESAHKIVWVEDELWTLVLAGPRRADWGFWVNGKFSPWREYLGLAILPRDE